MEPVVGAPDPGWDALRRLRAELGGSMSALERALVAPTPDRHAAWAQGVSAALAELSADFGEHVADTEGANGTHDAVLATTPRLSNLVRRLVSDHAAIARLVADLTVRLRPPVAADEVDAVCELGTALLGRLVRHRQDEADLIYQAYQIDLGGET